MRGGGAAAMIERVTNEGPTPSDDAPRVVAAGATNEAPTPSDDAPRVLAAGATDVTTLVASLSARHPEHLDAAYLEWHSLDHRPEQHRLAGFRAGLRVVSTPACRRARAASADRYDAVDHVVLYLFAGRDGLDPFGGLGGALRDAGRMPLRLPLVELGVYAVAERRAAPRVLVGADVVPWRPATGVYLLIEEGTASPEPLLSVPGVAGAWSFAGAAAPASLGLASGTVGRQLTCCFLDGDPVAVAEALGPRLRLRWAGAGVVPLLAAPFHTVVPFDWDRHLP